MKVLTLTLAVLIAGCATTTAPTIRPASYLAASLGSNMDSSDHRQANEVLESGSENKAVSWVNPVSGKRFTVTPTRTFKQRALDCRDFTAVYGGRTVSGAACRQEDGTWFLP